MAEKDKNAPKKSDPDPHEGARPEDELAPAVTVINTGGPGPTCPTRSLLTLSIRCHFLSTFVCRPHPCP
jgi:hypothetical protein